MYSPYSTDFQLDVCQENSLTLYSVTSFTICFLCQCTLFSLYMTKSISQIPVLDMTQFAIYYTLLFKYGEVFYYQTYTC